MRHFKWLIFIFIFLIGCSTVHNRDYAGYRNTFKNESSFYYQYVIVHKNEYYPFNADGDYLDSSVKSISCNIVLRNMKIPYTVWEVVTFSDVKTKEVYLKKEVLIYKGKELPGEKLLIINLPYKNREKVIITYYVKIKDNTSKVIYETSKTSYKIR